MIYLLAFISIFLGAGGQFVLKLVAGGLKTGGGLGQFVLSLLNIKMIAAISCFVTSMLLWILVLKKMELSIAYPMVSLGYVFVMLLSFYFLNEGLYFTKLIGTGLIVAGVIVLNLK
jgi:multidrug transporter EmrE-like cation transporter